MMSHTRTQLDRPELGRRYLFFAVTILMLISTLKVADRELLAPLYEPASQELGLNDLQFGTIRSATNVALIIGSILFGLLADRWRRRDPALPSLRISAQDIEMLHSYVGSGYAHPTPTARQAVALLAHLEGLPLETTYTGKAMAALLDHARRQPGARLLFVDTYAEAPTLEEGDYRDLPKSFWPIFDPSHPARCRCLRAWRDPEFCWKQRR